MKKTLSRLLCALLVAAMVCAMVPAVAADDIGSLSSPTVMYVGDTLSIGCQTPGHDRSCTVKYTTSILGDTTAQNSLSCSYLSYSTSTRKLTANYPTIKQTSYSNEFGYVKVVATCSASGCTDENKEQTAYIRVYSKASDIMLRNNNTTVTGDSITITKGSTVSLDYIVLSTGSKTNTTIPNTTACQDEVSVSSYSSVVSATADTSHKKISVTGSEVGIGQIVVTADGSTTHAKSRTLTVNVIDGDILQIKKNNTVVAQTGDDPIKGETFTLSTNANSNKFILTGSVQRPLGDTTAITWTSSKSSVASVLPSRTTDSVEVQILSTGEAIITASYRASGADASKTKTASYKIKVINAVTAVAIVDSNDKAIKDQELTGNLVVKAKTTPDDAESAKQVQWTSSNKEVATFASATDSDGVKATDSTVTIQKAGGAGTATITASINGKSASFTVTVPTQSTKRDIGSPAGNFEYTVRNGNATEITARMNDKYTEYPAHLWDAKAKKDSNTLVNVPITWDYTSNINTKAKTATVVGHFLDADRDGVYSYTYHSGRSVEATVNLTDDAVVSKLTVTGDKTTAVAGNVINLTATATVEPSDASVSYQWYVNGKAISGATARTAKYTIPEASVDSATEYKFTCLVTASKNGKSSSTESQPFTVTVSRDYTVSVTVNDAKATYTVGEKPKATATLYYKNNAVSGTSFTWTLLDNTKGNTLSNDLATISGSGNSATITTKGAAAAAGDKVLVQASVSYNGYTFSGTATITVNPASAKDVKMSVGTGSTIKGSAITSAVNTAINNTDLSVSYIVFGTPNGGSLYTSSTAKTVLGTAACYVSATGSQQKLNDVYFVPSATATAPSVTYSAYNAKGGVIATGKVTFDTTEVSGTNIYSKGTDFKTAGLVESLAPANVSTSTYVVFGNVKGGALYYDYKSFTSKTAVGSTDKFYFSGSDKQLADVYFVPAADTYTATIEYSIFNGSGAAAATDTITFTTVKQNSSRSFNDVTNANVGSWASNAVDFMSANALVGGTGTGKFSPMDKMTRAMLVTVLYRAAGSPSVTGLANPFTDVAKNQYYYNAVLWAYSKGVVTGNSATTFNPNGNISRQDIAAILYRYAGSPAATGSVTSFTDNAKISSYALTAMKWAVGSGYIGGSGNKLNPTGQATRAEVAVMLHRFLTK